MWERERGTRLLGTERLPPPSAVQQCAVRRVRECIRLQALEAEWTLEAAPGPQGLGPLQAPTEATPEAALRPLPLCMAALESPLRQGLGTLLPPRLRGLRKSQEPALRLKSSAKVLKTVVVGMQFPATPQAPVSTPLKQEAE